MSARPRAALILNPNATATTDELRDVIAAALDSVVDLEVMPTKRRGHATHLAAAAVAEGMDIVFSLGGDGTANEVLQSLARTDVTMGVIPGGGANVFARALGFPNDAVAATSICLDAIRAGRRRTINLGQAGDRYFSFDAGFGFDAAVVRSVEQHPGLKRRFKQAAFVHLAARQWIGDDQMRQPHVTVEFDDGTSVGPVGIVMIGNTDPYTYLGPKPIRMTPDATFDTGLDLTAVRRVSTAGLARVLAAVFRDGRHLDLPAVVARHDLDGFTVRSAQPTAMMVDGDYAGDPAVCRFRSVRSALTVLVPPTADGGKETLVKP